MWGKKKTDTTTIKRTTKIKQSYTVPTSNINPEVVIPTESKIQEEQVTSPKKYQTSNLQLQSNHAQIGKGMGSKISSRKSSSSSEKQRRRMEISLGNPNNYGLILDPPVVESNAPVLNETRAFQSVFEGEDTDGMHLGKNLYGETGYASPYYMMQHPFPGQTVYVEKWKQNIPQRTRKKFFKSSHTLTHQQPPYLHQQYHIQNSIPSVGQNHHPIVRAQNYQPPESSYESKNPYHQAITSAQRVNFEQDLNSVTKKSNRNPFSSLFTRKDNNKYQDQMVIKQKTKINQKYTLPPQNINPTVIRPTRDSPMHQPHHTKSKNYNIDFNHTQQPILYSEQPVFNSSIPYNQPKTTTFNLYNDHNNDPNYPTQSNIPNHLEQNTDSKGSTTIKQKTKIKENYTIPSQNIYIKSQPLTVPLNQNNETLQKQLPNVSFDNQNAPIPQSNIENFKYQSFSVSPQEINLGLPKQQTKNLQYIQSKYGQTDYQNDANFRQQSQYQTSNLDGQGKNSGKMNLNSDSTNLRPNADMSRQSTNIQQEYAPTRTGYGHERYKNINESNFVSKNDGGAFGKNLYGQTGYANFNYTIQQPFPGQTVYVPESPDKISNLKEEKFIQAPIN